jgi:hypothetical protein
VSHDSQPAGQTDKSHFRAALMLLGWAALMAPASVFLHELGHFLAGVALGYDDMVIGPAGVIGGAQLAVADPFAVAVQAGAGPAVTMALMALAWHTGPRTWSIALMATAPLRFTVGFTYLAFQLWFWLSNGTPGRPNFDEYNVAAALGISVVPIILGEVLLFAAALRWSASSHNMRQWLFWCALAFGTLIGLTAWITALGPILTNVVNRL